MSENALNITFFTAATKTLIVAIYWKYQNNSIC